MNQWAVAVGTTFEVPVLALKHFLELYQGGTKIVLQLAEFDVCGIGSATSNENNQRLRSGASGRSGGRTQWRACSGSGVCHVDVKIGAI